MDSSRDEPVARQVRDRCELEQALRLVHDNYVRRGYMGPEPSGIRLSVFYALPNTRTFVAVLRGEVVATMSLFCDSPLGLPADKLYREEICRLRGQGHRVGEVGMLADRRRSLGRSMPVLLQIMKVVFHAIRETELSDVVITVHPKHAGFYTRLLGFFERYGPEKTYREVGGAPAVLLHYDVIGVKPEHFRRESTAKLFYSPLPEGAEFQGDYRMRAEDLPYFFLERTDVLRQVDRETLSVIESQYPGLKLELAEEATVG